MGIEFAPIDTYRIDGIGRLYRREKNPGFAPEARIRELAQSAKRDLQCVKRAQPRTKHTNY